MAMSIAIDNLKVLKGVRSYGEARAHLAKVLCVSREYIDQYLEVNNVDMATIVPQAVAKGKPGRKPRVVQPPVSPERKAASPPPRTRGREPVNHSKTFLAEFERWCMSSAAPGVARRLGVFNCSGGSISVCCHE